MTTSRVFVQVDGSDAEAVRLVAGLLAKTLSTSSGGSVRVERIHRDVAMGNQPVPTKCTLWCSVQSEQLRKQGIVPDADAVMKRAREAAAAACPAGSLSVLRRNGLSTRAFKLLTAAGVGTIERARAMTFDELAAVPGMGKGLAQNVLAALSNWKRVEGIAA